MGAGIAILFFHEPTPVLFWISALLMGAGVWIHLTEKHNHTHIHYPDIHHRHKHK